MNGSRPAQESGSVDLPHSEEAEKGVCGSIMLSPAQVMPLCAESIDGAHYFHFPYHRTIYTAALDLWDSGRAIDLITVTQLLRDNGQLEAVGGPHYLTSLFNFVPTAANISYYLDIVREKFLLREIAAITTEAAKRAIEDNADVGQIVAEIHSRLTSFENPGQLPKIEDAARIVEREIELPPDVIEGLLHRGSKMVLGGGSKSFKTWQKTDLSVAVSTGGTWLGHKTQRGRVLYINLELAEKFFFKRLQQICRARGVTLDADYFHVWNLRGRAVSVSSITEELAHRRQEPYSLIVVDPIYKVLGIRDENKAGDIASLLNEVERLAVRTGAAVVFGAHFSKGNQAGKESIDRIGGSGVFARDPDSILIFTPHEEPNAFTVEATLRNHPPLEPFVVRWEYPLMQRADHLDPGALRQKPGRRKQFLASDLLTALQPTPPTTAEWQKRSGMSDGTFNRLRREVADRVKKEGNRWVRQ